MAWRKARLGSSISCSLLVQHVRHASTCIRADVAALQTQNAGFPNHNTAITLWVRSLQACTLSLCRLGASQHDSTEPCCEMTMYRHTEEPSTVTHLGRRSGIPWESSAHQHLQEGVEFVCSFRMVSQQIRYSRMTGVHIRDTLCNETCRVAGTKHAPCRRSAIADCATELQSTKCILGITNCTVPQPHWPATSITATQQARPVAPHSVLLIEESAHSQLDIAAQALSETEALLPATQQCHDQPAPKTFCRPLSCTTSLHAQ